MFAQQRIDAAVNWHIDGVHFDVHSVNDQLCEGHTTRTTYSVQRMVLRLKRCTSSQISQSSRQCAHLRVLLKGVHNFHLRWRFALAMQHIGRCCFPSNRTVSKLKRSIQLRTLMACLKLDLIPVAAVSFPSVLTVTRGSTNGACCGMQTMHTAVHLQRPMLTAPIRKCIIYR